MKFAAAIVFCVFVSSAAAEISEVEIPDNRKAATRSKLDAIVLPAVEFKNTPLSEGIRFLIEQSQKHDPDGVGVRIKIAPEVAAVPPMRGDFGLDAVPNPKPRDLRHTQITLLLSNAKLSEALRYTVQLVGLIYSIEDNGEITVTTRNMGSAGAEISDGE